MGVPTGTGGNVFSNLVIERIPDAMYKRFDKLYQGVDWGWFPDPYAFIRCHYDTARQIVYVLDELVVNEWGNDRTSDWIKEHGFDRTYTNCDSEEPKSVNDYRNRGLRATGAVKGPGSVEYGMKWLQRRKIVIDPKRTPVAAREFTSYEYARDKYNEFITGYPDKDNHTIDALRYALEPLMLSTKSVA